jgi:peptidoglycan/xylan/chitin deacetylase (PgdA/CDA1 family)
MNRFVLKIKTAFLLLLFLGSIQAQDVSIANWYNDKQAAVVLSFDDWLPSHANIVVQQLQNHQLPATFFVTIQNTKFQKNAFAIMRQAFANGCEIANHTLTHPDLTSLSNTDAQKEIFEARKILMDSIPGNPCLSFAFPMGVKNTELIQMLKPYHINSRGINAPNENNLPYNFIKHSNDYYKLETVRIWRVVTPKKVSNWLHYAAKGGGLLTFMIHSVVNDSNPAGWDPIPEKYLNEILDTVKAHQNNLWITTMANATQYHQQKNNTQVEVKKTSDFSISIKLVNNLNPQLFYHDLTLICNKEKEIKNIKIGMQNIKFEETLNGYQFNVPFNAKKVEIIYKN